MNISGVLVHARPENAAGVSARLGDWPGVEVHAVTDNGRLVVTVEHDEAADMADTVMKFNEVDGVLSAAMIYHHSEPDEPTEASK